VVDFTNVLQTALYVQITKAQKRHSSYQCLFALLGSACAKTASKILVKVTPGATKL